MRREEKNRRYANRRLSARLSYRALVIIITHILESYTKYKQIKKLLSIASDKRILSRSPLYHARKRYMSAEQCATRRRSLYNFPLHTAF
jgi:hypothetical protein